MLSQALRGRWRRALAVPHLDATACRAAASMRGMLKIVSMGLVAVALLGSAATAQLQKGVSPPVLEFDKVWNDGPQTFADLRGHVVILDFAQTW